VKRRRANTATRLTLIVLARFIEWRSVLTIVQPDTLVRWHRHAFRLFWIRNTDPRAQFTELVQQFDLAYGVTPFTRCHCCNGVLE
jgi:uncharacterized protein with PIN domain